MLTRLLSTKEAQINRDERTVTFPFSSRRPVVRWAWYENEYPEGTSRQFEEILSHQTSAWNLERVTQNVCPHLKNHDRNQKLGQVKSCIFDGERGFATSKLRQTPEADQFLTDLEDGTAGGISFGYSVNQYRVVSPAEYEYDDEGYRKVKKMAVLEATDIELYEISSEEIPADPTVGFGKSSEEKINLRTITIEGDPNFDFKLDNMNELEKTKADLSDLQTKYQVLESENKKLLGHVTELNEGIATRDSKIQFLEAQSKVTSEYFRLRQAAGDLVSEAKLSGAEYDDLFSDDANADIKRSLNEPGRLGNISFYLERAGKRSPQLNLKQVLKNEPLPEPPGLPQNPQQVQEDAENLVGYARNQTIYM
jgi:phage head maturation protease